MSKKDMIVVIQCTAGKSPSAGRMLTENKQPVMFVGIPQKVPPDESIIYKRPDELALRVRKGTHARKHRHWQSLKNT